MRGQFSESSDPFSSPAYLFCQGNLPAATLRRACAAMIAVTILLAVTTLATFSLLRHERHADDLRRRLYPAPDANAEPPLCIICNHTVYPSVCEEELSDFHLPSDAMPLEYVNAAVQATARRASEAVSLATRCTRRRGLSKLERQCANDCVELLHDVNAEMRIAAARISSLNATSDAEAMQAALADVKVWLSSAISYQSACSDNFQVALGSTQALIQSNQAYLSKVIGFTLSFVDILARIGNDLNAWLGALPPIPSFVEGPHRRLLSTETHFKVDDGFPHWVSAGERRLLQASSSSAAAFANVVVAQDGSGNFTNITAALNAMPKNYGGRYVIYIKQGVYAEVFNVTNRQQNITFVGDGIGLTIVTGSRNVASGDFNTYRTSTVGIAGTGFYARDITFQNTAGPGGHQAVAVRAGADYLVFYHCSFESYQDTLYALSSRQFYRECTISGTIDFIFGNAIAVFQNCLLVARLPMQGQQNTYTAQGRKLEADVSGFSFQNCTLTGELALGSTNYTVRTYLGRPWKAYSRVVFMESELQGLVDPTGWLPWNHSNPFTDTVYYGEYNNRGGGADTSRRVSWAGVHPNMSQADASLFTLSNFIATGFWLDSLQTDYDNIMSFCKGGTIYLARCSLGQGAQGPVYPLPCPLTRGACAPALNCTEPNPARYTLPPLQKLMMLGSSEEEHKEMDCIPIRENDQNFL